MIDPMPRPPRTWRRATGRALPGAALAVDRELGVSRTASSPGRYRRRDTERRRHHHTMPDARGQMCSQLSRIFSNTGAVSFATPVTHDTSAVAVCRSSASRVSLNRRTFSVAMTADPSLQQLDLFLSGKAPVSARQAVIAPATYPSFIIGTAVALR